MGNSVHSRTLKKQCIYVIYTAFNQSLLQFWRSALAQPSREMEQSQSNLDVSTALLVVRLKLWIFIMYTVQSGVSGCEKCVASVVWESPLAWLGSTTTAAQPNGLWNCEKTFYTTFFTTCRPRLYITSQPWLCSDRAEVRPGAAAVADRVRAVRCAVHAQVRPEGAADGRRRARAPHLSRGRPLRTRLSQVPSQRTVHQGLHSSLHSIG